jgi:hypothetical protein
LLFLPLTSFGYRVAYTIWTLVSVALLVVVARMLESHGNVSLALSQYARISVDFGLILVLFLTFAPRQYVAAARPRLHPHLVIYTLVFILLLRGKNFWLMRAGRQGYSSFSC